MSMNRRTFIRVVGGVGLTSAAAFRYVVGAEKAALATAGILVEAASFAAHGGWKLDTQHYQHMGVATGYAAALCKKHSATPRVVGKKHIKELLGLTGYA